MSKWNNVFNVRTNTHREERIGKYYVTTISYAKI